MPIQGIAKTLRQLADQLDEIAAGEASELEHSYTFEEVRAALTELASQKGEQHVKDLMKQFGAKKLSDVFPADYQALMQKANGRD